MTSSNKLLWGVLILVFGLGVAGFVGPSSATTEETAVSLPIEKVADYLYAVIEADREVYTKHVVERMQAKGVVVASENWEEKYAASPGSIPDGVRPRHGKKRHRHTVSIDQPLADQQAECRPKRVREGRPGYYSHSSD